jgi:parallel beta-helix repeat protein
MKTKLLAIPAILVIPALFAQGPLTPPGAPAPTMKTLDEIEPRTNLQATPAPSGVSTTDPDYCYVINQPGSYYLSANLIVQALVKPNGILINATDVTLDLNGFRISRGTTGGGGGGIDIASMAHRASIRNGSISGFAYGVHNVVGAGDPTACVFRGLAVSGCTQFGIEAGPGALLEACRAHDNTGSVGIQTLSGSTLINCSAYGNESSETASIGISAGSGSTISHCTARSNSSPAGTSPTAGVGFQVGSGSTIVNCTASANQGDGIRLTGNRSHVLGNTCAGNSTGGQGANIHLTNLATACRVDGNHCTGGVRGVFVEGTDNLVVRNSAQGATAANYDIVPGNHDAARVTSPGAAFTSTNPWANFSF